MIRIRCLPPAAMASLLVKTAEKQLAARKHTNQTCNIFADPYILYVAKAQKEGRSR